LYCTFLLGDNARQGGLRWVREVWRRGWKAKQGGRIDPKNFNTKKWLNIFFFTQDFLFLRVHELDAMRCREWRIFPGLSLLNGKLGQTIFVFAHIPLFFFVFYGLTEQSNIDNFVKGVDVFMMVHVGLHLLLLKHKNNEFKDWASWTIIIGSGFFGLADLIV
jgi:hypothetical protein